MSCSDLTLWLVGAGIQGFGAHAAGLRRISQSTRMQELERLHRRHNIANSEPGCAYIKCATSVRTLHCPALHYPIHASHTCTCLLPGRATAVGRPLHHSLSRPAAAGLLWALHWNPVRFSPSPSPNWPLTVGRGPLTRYQDSESFSFSIRVKLIDVTVPKLPPASEIPEFWNVPSNIVRNSTYDLRCTCCFL